MKKLEERPPFDTVIRAEGTLNVKVAEREVTEKYLDERKKVQGIARSLGIIEAEAIELIEGESVINMRQSLVQGLRRVF